jgi:hypothetical protein
MIRPLAAPTVLLALTGLAAALLGCSKATPPTPPKEVATPAPPAALPPLPRRPLGPVAAASPDEATALLTRLAAERGLTAAETAAVTKAWFDGPMADHPEVVFSRAPFNATNFHKLYRVDADNDGRDDWVIVSQNPVSDHRSGVEHVYTEQGGKLSELPFDDIVSKALYQGRDLGPNFHMYADDPFAVVEAAGTILSFSDTYPVDAQGAVVGPMDARVKLVDKHYRYLWKGQSFTLVEKQDRSVDVKE